MSEQPKKPIKSLSPTTPGEQWKKRGTPWNDPEFESNFPTLTLYLTQTAYEGGTTRQLATMTLFMDNGCLTVVLNDRENQRSLFVSEASLFGCLLKIETSLDDGSADWRAAKTYAKPKSDIPF